MARSWSASLPTRTPGCETSPSASGSRNERRRAGYLTKTRIGRRNRYRVEGDRKVAVAFGTVTVGQLLSVVLQALERQPFG
jgi:hypothetical protein